MKDAIAGIIIYASIIACLFMLAGLAQAQTWKIDPGGSGTIQCTPCAGQPPKPELPDTEPPKPELPGGCKSQVKYKIEEIFTGEKKVGLYSGESHAYKFNSKMFDDGKSRLLEAVPQFVPGSGSRSELHTISVSECPGDFDAKKLGICLTTGNEIALRMRVHKPSNRRCVIDRNKIYYFNVAAYRPSTGEWTCKKSPCGVQLKVPR